MILAEPLFFFKNGHSRDILQSLVSTKKNLGKQFAPDKWDYGHTDRILWPNLEAEPLYILFYKEHTLFIKKTAYKY